MAESLVIDILKYIDNNLYDNIKVEDIANYFHFDRSYLTRVFKKYTGLSLVEYINERKILKSLKQVINSDDKILKIALSNGFNSLEYFSETFYRITNFSPLSLREYKEVKEITFDEYDNHITNTIENHKKILFLRTLPKHKTKRLGVYNKKEKS